MEGSRGGRGERRGRGGRGGRGGKGDKRGRGGRGAGGAASSPFSFGDSGPFEGLGTLFIGLVLFTVLSERTGRKCREAALNHCVLC